MHVQHCVRCKYGVEYVQVLCGECMCEAVGSGAEMVISIWGRAGDMAEVDTTEVFFRLR